jgi:pimeloyl-ACP methyl ester carboxylesterase
MIVNRRNIRIATLLISAASAGLLGSCLSGAGTSTTSTTDQHLVLKPCKLAGLDGDTRCGTYEVFENRDAKSGRTIKLKIVVLKALNGTPAPDAIFPLAGGPGAPATSMVDLAHDEILAPARQDHDIVFVDQRGTGGSNPLVCDVGDDPRDMAAFFGDILPIEKVQACRNKLQAIADLRLYTTPIAMDDLDEVRSALGYDKIDLLGVSYGTIAAQVYLRQHAEHARSAFLVGVATPNIKQPLLFPRSAQHAMDMLYTDCARDPVCHSTFPDLQKEFEAVLHRFDNGPLTMKFIDPITRKKIEVKVARSNFVERIRLAMYSTESQAFVPLIIHRAYVNDYLPFEKAALVLSPGADVSRGVYFTITCSEGVRFISDSDVVNETRGTYVGPERVTRHIKACQEWPKGEIAPSYIEPVKSDVPVLMISGEVDGSSPTWFGESAVKFLSNGRQIKIRYLGHQIEGACLSDIFKSFVTSGSSKAVNGACAEGVRRPPFATKLPPWFRLD